MTTDATTSMLRSRVFQRFGSRLALIALLLQTVLAFGHCHPDDGLAAGLRTGRTELAATAQLKAPASQRDTDAGQHEACAICATIALAGSLLLPAAARLPVPPPAGIATSPRGSDYGLTPPPHLLFQTRAPPVG